MNHEMYDVVEKGINAKFCVLWRIKLLTGDRPMTCSKAWAGFCYKTRINPSEFQRELEIKFVKIHYINKMKITKILNLTEYFFIAIDKMAARSKA
jgi:hypothetical protein